METKIVLGHTFGDEGKGVTVQWLCKKALDEGKKPLVVRFSGGPQAAHTVFNGGVEHICSSFGSGVLLGVPTWLMPDVYVDPICLMKEYDVLKSKGIEPKIFLGDNRIITPYDVIAGQNDEKVRKDGTCGKGLYKTFHRYINNSSSRLYKGMKPNVCLSEGRVHHRATEMAEYDEMFCEAMKRLPKGSVWDWTEFRWEVLEKEYDVLIFEGSQGLLLDMDCGFYPNVTPSNVGLKGIPPSFLEDGAEVYLVTRTYTTRHGNGYKPAIKVPYDLSDKHETNVCNEYQGEFKTGILEMPLLNQAYERHCIDNYVAKYGLKLNLVVTHMDVPMKHGEFLLLDEGESIDRIPVDSPSVIAGYIYLHLNYQVDKIYYNDSVESNIKEV